MEPTFADVAFSLPEGGISDIVRQVSNPNETLGAQQIKSNFGLMRMQPRQKPFERFIRATLRIMAEVIAEKFARRTLERITGHDLGSKALPGSPEAQIGDAVMALLRDDRLRSYRVDVETEADLTRGRTIVDTRGVPGDPPNVEVGLSIDRARYVDLLIDAIGSFR